MGRSHSRGSSLARNHFCHIRDCSRAARGFPRRGNLARHLRLVHGIEASTMPVDVDSEDEMYGAVHIDGFLKPIRMRKGWRGGDLGTEKRLIGRGKRKRRGRKIEEAALDTHTNLEEEDPESGVDSEY